MNKTTTLLRIDASARQADSSTRQLTDALLSQLRARYGRLSISHRDLAQTPVPGVDNAWIHAASTDPAQRDVRQRSALALSDELIAELMTADLIVMGVPIYNFGIPATLKAWVDQVARARVTFRYTDKGPEGLLKGKRAYIVVASGGVAVGSDTDYATGYLRHVLAFLGIVDVTIIAADRQMLRADALETAQRQIRDVFTSAA